MSSAPPTNAQTPPTLAPSLQLSRIRLACFDVDGVLTDGAFYYDADGVRLLRFHVLDGMGLKRLMQTGVKTCFISQSVSPIISTRARDLGVTYCFAGIEDKLSTIAALLAEEDYSFDQVCHMADDINDLPLLRKVGVPVAVPNAVAEVMRACAHVTNRFGGQGAVRELCDAVIESQRVFG